MTARTAPARPVAAAPVDWALAAGVAGRLVRPGPAAERTAATDLVADLRRAADAAVDHVMAVTAMVPAGGAGATVSRVLVVDRPQWARANTEMLDALTADLPTAPGEQAPSRVTRLAGGVQLGGVLAALSGKVLGQFDPFSARPGVGGVAGVAGVAGEEPVPGRLLLVAPNVLEVERALRVDPADFRLWVALHEQTHALQFATAPWLADHLRVRMASVVAGLVHADGPRTPGRHDDERGPSLLAGMVRVAGGAEGGLAALLPPDARRVVDEVGAVMALLEGHADVAMDAVGRSVVPTVRQIRTRFERRRAAPHGATSVVLRRVLGLDLKLAQYRDGARFVRRVRRAVGTDGLNAVWAGPEQLPSAGEIAEPRRWVRRVHG